VEGQVVALVKLEELVSLVKEQQLVRLPELELFQSLAQMRIHNRSSKEVYLVPHHLRTRIVSVRAPVSAVDSEAVWLHQTHKL